MFRASLRPSSGALDRILLHVVFSTGCAGWCLGEQGSRPCALCTGCYFLSLNVFYVSHQCAICGTYQVTDIHLRFTPYIKGWTVNGEVNVAMWAMSKALRIAAILESGGGPESPFLFDLGFVRG